MNSQSINAVRLTRADIGECNLPGGFFAISYSDISGNLVETVCSESVQIGAGGSAVVSLPPIPNTMEPSGSLTMTLASNADYERHAHLFGDCLTDADIRQRVVCVLTSGSAMVIKRSDGDSQSILNQTVFSNNSVFVLSNADSFRLSSYAPFVTLRINPPTVPKPVVDSVSCLPLGDQSNAYITASVQGSSTVDVSELGMTIVVSVPSYLYIRSVDYNADSGKVDLPVTEWGHHVFVSHSIEIPVMKCFVIHQVCAEPNNGPIVIRHYVSMSYDDSSAQSFDNMGSSVSDVLDDLDIDPYNAVPDPPYPTYEFDGSDDHEALHSVDVPNTDDACGVIYIDEDDDDDKNVDKDGAVCEPVLPKALSWKAPKQFYRTEKSQDEESLDDQGSREDEVEEEEVEEEEEKEDSDSVADSRSLSEPGSDFQSKQTRQRRIDQNEAFGKEVIYQPAVPRLSLQGPKNIDRRTVASLLQRHPLMFSVKLDRSVFFGNRPNFQRCAERALSIWDTRYYRINSTVLEEACQLLMKQHPLSEDKFPFCVKSGVVASAYKSPAWKKFAPGIHQLADRLRKAGLFTGFLHSFCSAYEMLVWYYACNVEQPFLVNAHIAWMAPVTIKKLLPNPADSSMSAQAALYVYRTTDVFYAVLTSVHAALSWSFNPDPEKQTPFQSVEDTQNAIDTALLSYKKSSTMLAIAYYALFVLAWRHRATLSQCNTASNNADMQYVNEMSSRQYSSVVNYLATNTEWIDLIGTDEARELHACQSRREQTQIIEMILNDDTMHELFRYIDPIAVAMHRARSQFAGLLFTGKEANKTNSTTGGDGSDESDDSDDYNPGNRNRDKAKKRARSTTDSDKVHYGSNKKAKSNVAANLPGNQFGDFASSAPTIVKMATSQSSSLVVCPLSGRLVMINLLSWLQLFTNRHQHVPSLYNLQNMDSMPQLSNKDFTNQCLIRDNVLRFGQYLHYIGATIDTNSTDLTSYMNRSQDTPFPGQCRYVNGQYQSLSDSHSKVNE